MTWNRSYLLRSVRLRKRRFALGTATVLLTTMLMLAVGLFFTATQGEFQGVLTRTIAYDLTVNRGLQGDNLTLFDGSDVVGKASGVKGVTGVYPALTAPAVAASGNATYSVLLFGVSASYSAGHVRSLAGSYSLNTGEVVLSKEAARALGTGVGGSLSLSASPLLGGAGGPAFITRNYTVAGVVDVEGRFPAGAMLYALVSPDEAGALLNASGLAAVAFITVDQNLYELQNTADPVGKVLAVGKEVALALGPAYRVDAVRAYLIRQAMQATGFIGTSLYIFTVIFPAVSGLMISSVLTISVEEKRKELALLRLMGARRRAVLGVVVGELGLYLLAGLPPGALAGLGLPFLLAPGRVASVAPVQAASTAALQVLISVGILLAFTAGPLRKAFSASPAEAVRNTVSLGEFRYAGEHGIDRRVPAASAVIFAAVAYSTIAIPYILVFASPETFVLFIAISILILLVTLSVALLIIIGRIERGMVALAEPLTRRFNRVTRASLARYARRNISTNIIFGVVAGIVIFFASMVESVEASAAETVRYEVGSDIRVNLAFPVTRFAVTQLADRSGVESWSPVTASAGATVSALVGPSGTRVKLYGVEPSIAQATYLGRSDFASGGPETFSPPSNTSIVLSRQTAVLLGVGAGDRVLVQMEGRSPGGDDIFGGDGGLPGGSSPVAAGRRSHLVVVGVLNSMPGFAFEITKARGGGQGAFVGMEQYLYLTGRSSTDPLYSTVFAKAAPGHDAEKTGREMRNAFALTGTGSVLVSSTLIESVLKQTQLLDFGFTAILSCLMVVAVFSLASSMYATVMERRFEIGVLKAVGYRTRQVTASFLLEGTVIGLASLVVGILTGVLVAFIAVGSLNIFSPIDLRFVLPWDRIALLGAISLFGSAAASWATVRGVASRPAVELLWRGE